MAPPILVQKFRSHIALYSGTEIIGITLFAHVILLVLPYCWDKGYHKGQFGRVPRAAFRLNLGETLSNNFY